MTKEEIERKFGELENLKEIFYAYERQLRCVHLKRGEETKEEILRRRDTVLEILQTLTNRDLILLFYIRKIKRFSFPTFYQLKKLYEAQCEFENALNGSSDFSNPFQF